VLRFSTQGLGLLHNVSYGVDDDLGLFSGHGVPGAGLDEFAKFGSGGQIDLKLMPIDRQPILFRARGAGQTFVLQDYQRNIKAPLEAFARLQLAGGFQKLISIESAVLCCIPFCNSR